MFHVSCVLERNRSQGKSWNVESGWMNDGFERRFNGTCSMGGLLEFQIEDL